jgi:hypothetical protein
MVARRRDVTIRPEPARAEARVPAARVIALTARAIGIAALVGFSFGVPAAGLSTIRFTPQDGFDGWWTRLSEGFAIAGFLAGLLSWLLDWRVELEWEGPRGRGWGLRIRKLSLKERHGRTYMKGWRLFWTFCLAAVASAFAWFLVWMAWP